MSDTNLQSPEWSCPHICLPPWPGTPKIIPEKNSVDIWDLVICTGQTSMYILNTFPSTLTSQMAKNHKDKCILFLRKSRTTTQLFFNYSIHNIINR